MAEFERLLGHAAGLALFKSDVAGGIATPVSEDEVKDAEMIDAGLTDIEPREAKGQVVETRNAETMKNKGREIEIAMAEIWVDVQGTVLEGRSWDHIMIGYYELKASYRDIEEIAKTRGLSWLPEEKRQFLPVLEAYKHHLFGEKEVLKERGRLIQFLKVRNVEEAHCLERIGRSLIGRRLKKEVQDSTVKMIVYKRLECLTTNKAEGELTENLLFMIWMLLGRSYSTWKDLKAQYQSFTPTSFSQQAPNFIKLMKNLDEIVFLQKDAQSRFAAKQDRMLSRQEVLTGAEVLEEIRNYEKVEQLRMEWVKDCMTYETLKRMIGGY